MAKPIKPTPVLKDKDARKFSERMTTDLKKPLKVNVAPCLKKAKKAVFSGAIACAQ